MREELLGVLGCAAEHEHAAVLLEQRSRGGGERLLQPKRVDESVDAWPKHDRDRGGLEPREIEALVAQSVLFVAWVPPAEPQPRAQLVHDVQGVVEVAIARHVEVDEVACRDFVQIGVGAEHTAGGAELVAAQAARCVLESARLSLREVVRRERRLVASVGRHERADTSVRDVDRRLEGDVDAGSRGRDQHCLDEGAEREEEVALRGIAGR